MEYLLNHWRENARQIPVRKGTQKADGTAEDPAVHKFYYRYVTSRLIYTL